MKQALISALFGAISGALICALSIGTGPVPWLASKIAGPADASQNQLSSPSTGTVSGLQLTNNFNNALDSLNTCNSGASAPTNQLSGSPSTGNCWLDTSAAPYKLNYYDGAQWVTWARIDATNHQINLPIGGGTGSIVSAATVDLCNSSLNGAHSITITGATTITSFGSTCKAGFAKLVTFSGALTITYNATSLIVPGAANIVTAAGDQALLLSLGSGNWQIAFYQPASGQALLNPAIDVGAVEWTFSPNVPSAKYLWGFGQAISRSTYSTLLTALTITQSVTATNGSPTLTGFSDTTQIATGAKVEASFVPGATTIVSCTSSTCTLSANATASTTGSVTVFNYGDGDGSTTFNLPDCRGAVMAGRDNMGGTAKGTLTSANYGTNPDALGAAGGAQTRSIAQNQLPNVTPALTGTPATITTNQTQVPNYVTSGWNLVTFQGAATSEATIEFPSGGADNPTIGSLTASYTPTGTVAINGGVTQQALPTIQPTITANCMIRVLSFLEPMHGAPTPVATNDNQFAAIEPRRVAA